MPALCTIRSSSVLALVVVLLCAPASASARRAAAHAHAPVSPADAAATRAYLEAMYQFELALVHNALASQAAETAIAEQLGHECHGVLAGEPAEELELARLGGETPRARGERGRSELQVQTIEEELSSALTGASYQPDRAALEAYAAKVAPLSWSDPGIGPLAQYPAQDLDQDLAPPSGAEVCADMKAWEQSGFHVLSVASREFQASRRQASVRAQLERAELGRAEPIDPAKSLDMLLKPYEDAADRRLARRTEALEARYLAALVDDLHGLTRLRHALGVRESASEKQEEEPALARRRTRAGETFTIRTQLPSNGLPGRGCKHAVSVEVTETAEGSVLVISSESGTTLCVSPHPEQSPSSSCGNGIESIVAVTPASVRTVQLQLSDGRMLSSRVVHISRKEGGPAGVYVEAVRGSEQPVSLTELDGAGNVVKVVQLHEMRCRREPSPEAPTFVDLATGAVPGGEPFLIRGLVSHLLPRHPQLTLLLGAGSPSEHNETASPATTKPKAFSWSLAVECPPHEYALVYGILSAPGGSVLARTPQGLVALTKVALAPDLHAGGSLVYGAFATVPSELVVRRSDGSTLYTESLATMVTEEREYCEGYAEA